MAARIIFTNDGSFWQVGGPDLERSKLFIMIETAENHHFNLMKTALAEFKRNSGKFIAINPVRIGYAGIADEWVPIKPGTDGALFLSIINEIYKQGLFGRDFLINNTNSIELVNMDDTSSEHGMFVHFEAPKEEDFFDAQNKLWRDRELNSPNIDAERWFFFCTGESPAEPLLSNDLVVLIFEIQRLWTKVHRLLQNP